jgi:hypothetical protein
VRVFSPELFILFGPIDSFLFCVVCSFVYHYYYHFITGRLHIIATMFLQRYSDATSKVEKSNIVSAVIGTVRDACPGDQRGAFIKFREGRWWAVEESHVRERIGSILRDFVVMSTHKALSSSSLTSSGPKAKNTISMRLSDASQQQQKQKQNPLKPQSPSAVAENSTSETEDDDEESHNELLEWNQQLDVSYDNLDALGDEESSLSDVFD